MLSIDFHSHSIASVHAMNTIQEMLLYADSQGIQGLAITDHCPGLDNTLWLMENESGKAKWKSQIRSPDLPYFMTLLTRYQPPEHIKTKLYRGIECNILSSGDFATDVPWSAAHKFDVIIASVHPMPNVFVIESSEQVTERMILAMDSPIDIIGHPYHRIFCPEIEPVVRAAAEKGITLELNNASHLYNKVDAEKGIEMLTLARQYDCTISISSDGHMINELALDNAIRPILEQTDFPDELIVNRTLQSADEFVEQRKKKRAEIKASSRT